MSHFMNMKDTELNKDTFLLETVLKNLKLLRWVAKFWILRKLMIDASNGVCGNTLCITKNVLFRCARSWEHPEKRSGGWFISGYEEYAYHSKSKTLWSGDQLEYRLHFMNHAINAIKAELKRREEQNGQSL